MNRWSRLLWTLTMLLVLGLACPPLVAHGSTPQTPQTSPLPPLPPCENNTEMRPGSGLLAYEAEPVGEPLSLPPLKAVLIVGPIDGDTGEWTLKEKANMDLAAEALTAHGVTVHTFYTPNDSWEQISAAAVGAHFLLYRGHGVYLTDMPTPDVGGFALSEGIIRPDRIRSDLKLAPNAIVMLYGCFTAGTAGSDTVSIGSAEAQRRVAQYSDTFLDIGAGGYFANWFGGAFPSYVNSLFAGQTQAQAYEAFFDYSAETVEHHMHPYAEHNDQAMWLDNDFWDNLVKYNNAFVGQPDATLETLFGDQSHVVPTPEPTPEPTSEPTPEPVDPSTLIYGLYLPYVSR
jgi:hypothetical protein